MSAYIHTRLATTNPLDQAWFWESQTGLTSKYCLQRGSFFANSPLGDGRLDARQMSSRDLEGIPIENCLP